VTSSNSQVRAAALPPSPDQVLDDHGAPRFGVFEGIPKTIDLANLGAPFARNRAGRFLRHKKWMYVFAATDEIIVAGAIVDAGPTGTGFLMVTDRATGEVLADASRPGGMGPLVRVSDSPLLGHRAHYALPATLMTSRGDDRELRVQATIHSLPYVPLASEPWIDLDMWIEHDAHPGILAVSEVADGHRLMTTTAKNAALPTRGELTIRKGGSKTSFSLAAGLGGFDYTSGYLPRNTSWRWAYLVGRSTTSRLIGLNLVSNFTGIGDRAQENVVWVDGKPHRLDPSTRIDCDLEEPMKPWTVTSSDGAVALEFTPMAIHKEDLNLGVVRSHFLQPTGHFSGQIKVNGETLSLKALPGVVEDQDVVW
jgi:hypothetical protein